MLRKFTAAIACSFLLAAPVSAQAASPELPQERAELLKKQKKPARQFALSSLRTWMSPEVGDAWRQGYLGKGSTITIVDDFTSGVRSKGDLGFGPKWRRHGEWTRDEARMIAPSATIRSHNFRSGKAVSLGRGLNVANLSYGMFAPGGYEVDQIRWSAQEKSLINHAKAGMAVVVKAAGNDGVAVGATASDGMKDYLNEALVGGQSAIFVGALKSNGTARTPASLAGYSNFAGDNAAVQKQFLTVGVEGHKTGLHGTSFAAPVVSGYSAILASKFTRATPTQITNRLLDTARTDTIKDYDRSIHGRGEASITRALAPRSIR